MKRTFLCLGLVIFFGCTPGSDHSKSPDPSNGKAVSARVEKVIESESGADTNYKTIHISRPPEMLDKDYFGKMMIITNFPPPHEIGPGQGGAEYIHYLIDNIFYGVKDIKWNWGVKDFVKNESEAGGLVWIGHVNNAMVFTNESNETVVKWTCQVARLLKPNPDGLRERPIKIKEYTDDYFILTLTTPQSVDTIRETVNQMLESEWHVIVAGYPHSIIEDGDRTLVNVYGINFIFLEKPPIMIEG